MNFCPTIGATRRQRPRRGIIFVTAMWVIVILAAMVLIFARSMRMELTAAGNRLSTQQAATLELGAEQYVISAVDGCNGDAVSVLQTPAEQVPLADGFFWILQTYPDDDTKYAFGITDENSKLNLNTATDPMLASLVVPGMTQEIADSIINWNGSKGKTQGQGADASYYPTLGRPYTLKAAPFETVEELYLIKDVDDKLMWGYDLDHNGMIDDAENKAGGSDATLNSVPGTGRGIVPFVTAWGIEPNTDANGKPRINISALAGNNFALRNALKALPAARVNLIVSRAAAIRVFRNLFDFALKTGMKSSELSQVEDSLTTVPAKVLPGLINVNTASQQVLMCLPGLTQEDAANVIAQRATTSGAGASDLVGSVLGGSTSATPPSAAWIMDVITPQKAAAIGNLITGRSFFYSADIVAASGDGRAFKRVRIVVDARNSPPLIVYRKDLTNLGWPLSPDILAALRAHKPLPAQSGMGTGGGNGLTMFSQ